MKPVLIAFLSGVMASSVILLGTYHIQDYKLNTEVPPKSSDDFNGWDDLEDGYVVYPVNTVQTYFCKIAGTSYGILYGSDCRDISCLHPGARYVLIDTVVLSEGITIKTKNMEWKTRCGRDTL